MATISKKLTLFLGLVVNAALAIADPPPKPAALAWMSGSWSGTKDGVASEEHWTTAEGGMLVGMHKDVRDGRAISFELQLGELMFVSANNFSDPISYRAGIDLDVIVCGGQFSQKRLRDFAIGRNNAFTALGIYDIERNFFAQKDVGK